MNAAVWEMQIDLVEKLLKKIDEINGRRIDDLYELNKSMDEKTRNM